jgi:hypothetical protein
MVSKFEEHVLGVPNPDVKPTPVLVALDLQDHAKRLVFEHVKVKGQLESTNPELILKPEDVYCVWFTKTLQNWKAMVSTNLVDGMYYEVTHDGDRKRTYIDAYHRNYQVVIPDTTTDF